MILPNRGIARLSAFALAFAMLFSLVGCSAIEWEAQTIDSGPSVPALEVLEETKEASSQTDTEEEAVTSDDIENAGKDSEKETSSAESVSGSPEETAEDDVAQEEGTEPETNETTEPVSYTYTELTQTMYATTALNVRSGPSTDYGVIGGYAKGDTVTVTGQCDQTSWYQVSYSGKSGYVSNQYVSETAPVAETEQNTSSSFSSNSSGKVTSYDGYVTPKGSISVSLLETANANAAKLPQVVRDAFTSDGWTICISEADIDDTYCGGKYGSLLGLTDTAVKTIYLANNQEGVSYQTIAHETGHFWDWYYKWPSQTSEFSAIYSEEWSTFKSTFHYSNGSQTSYELFAEGFYRYLVSGDQLKASCPKTYAFLSEYCNF